MSEVDDILKFKRQVRDWYNKHVLDMPTIRKVATIINFNNAKENTND